MCTYIFCLIDIDIHYDKKRGYQGKRSAALYIYKFSFKHETVSIELRVHFASFLYARAVA